MQNQLQSTISLLFFREAVILYTKNITYCSALFGHDATRRPVRHSRSSSQRAKTEKDPLREYANTSRSGSLHQGSHWSLLDLVVDPYETVPAEVPAGDLRDRNTTAA